jgi:ATP-binding cassette subfamily B protein
VQKADKIIVLHRGTIREMGTHQELLQRRGLYYKLYELQYAERPLANAEHNKARLPLANGLAKNK